MEELSHSKACFAGIALALALVGCGGGGADGPPPPPPPAVSVSVSPASVTVLTGTTQLFTATVTGTSNTAVTWSVDNTVGGDATVGMISAGGLYTAPAIPSQPNTVTVKATSAADPTKSDTASVTLNNPVPVLTSISPAAVNAGTGDTVLTVNGSAFNPQSQVRLAGTDLATTFVSSSRLTAQIPAAMLATAGAAAVTVVTPQPGGGTSAPVGFQVVMVAPVSVTITPGTTTVLTGQSQPFSATVTGDANTSVTWAVNGLTGGTPALGTIDSNGLYVAPPVPPSPNPVAVKATSVADPTKSDTASVTVNNPPPSLLSISPASVNAGSSDTLLLVTGSGFAQQSVVQLAGSGLTTSFLSPTQLEALIPNSLLGAFGTFAVTVATPAPGGGTTAGKDFEVRLVISVSPGTASVITTDSQQFTATVVGSADTDVAWSIDGAGQGDSVVGAISGGGLYTAPQLVPNPAGITVRATSHADPSRSDAAALTITSVIEDWPKFRRDLANTGRSRETLIHSGNVSQLKKKWQFSVDAMAGEKRISASPAVATVGGMRTAYVGAWSGFFYAVNAETGQLRWRFEVDRSAVLGATRCTTTSRCRIGSSAAVANGIVYFGAEDGSLYALNAATGARVWKASLGDPEVGYEVWSSPAVHNGVVYVGVASHSAAPCVVGRVDALNAATGAKIWSFETIDRTSCVSGTCSTALGAGVWSSPAIDEQFGLLYVGTGNAGKGCSPSTANALRYPDGILGLDLVTGGFKYFFQTFVNDINDEGDIGAAPVLHQTRVVDECGGTDLTRHWLTVPTKDSVVYTAERDATGLLGTPFSILLASGDAIAAPSVQRLRQSQACGPGPEQLIVFGNDIVVPTFDGKLFGIRQQADPDPDLPFIRWTTIMHTCDPANPCPLFSAPASVTDLVFFGGGDGNFYATTADGVKVYSTGTLGLVASGPAISGGRVYFGSYDGNLYCLSLNGQ